MKCVICKQGTTSPGEVMMTLQREDTTVIFKKVPAVVCDNCGEYYLSEEMTDKLLNRADSAIKNGAEVEILNLQLEAETI